MRRVGIPRSSFFFLPGPSAHGHPHSTDPKNVFILRLRERNDTSGIVSIFSSHVLKTAQRDSARSVKKLKSFPLFPTKK